MNASSLPPPAEVAIAPKADWPKPLGVEPKALVAVPNALAVD